MFYLFNVNQGCAQHLEVSAALGSVRNLQQSIEKITQVPVQEQVLLLNGGEGLHPDRTVAFYQGCGTDSNPVFLFYKIPEGEQLNIVSPEYEDFIKMWQEVDKRLKLYEDASLSTTLVSRYIESARAAFQLTENGYQLCSRIFQEHQFLYQGWLALMSNFEECCAQIQKRVEKFFLHYEKMKVMKTKAQSVVQDFDAALDLMEKIVIPASLLEKSKQLETGTRPDGECSLYDFIAASDPKNSLRDVVSGILESIAQMDDSAYYEVRGHLDKQGQFAKSSWQEIGGINGRFQHLDKEIRILEQRTSQMKQISTVISQTGHSSASSVKDVIAKQRAQMVEVQKTLIYVYNTLNSFMGSKKEVLDRIRERISKHALQAYDRLHMLNNAVTVYEEKYAGLRNRLDIIRQVKESPIIYIMAVSETVRRSVLQQEFMAWFNKFMEKSQKLVREETTLRDAFTVKLEHHFLKQLFPGLFDAFPTFAPAQLPSFDQDLPSIDVSYIAVLKQAVPSHACLLKINKPFIYHRLAINDAQPPWSPTTNILGREDSFAGPSSPGAASFSKHFSSANWLSGDDNVDLSPSKALFFVKTPTSHFGSSADLDIAVSPGKPLNSLPSIDASFPQPESGLSSSVMRTNLHLKSSPIKIYSQQDPVFKHFEFFETQKLTQEDALSYLKNLLKSLKSFSESLASLKQSQGDLKGVVEEVVIGVNEALQKYFAVAEKSEKCPDNLILPLEESKTVLLNSCEQATTEASGVFEEKIKGELDKVRKETEDQCKMQFNIVLEAKVNAVREETEKACNEKASETLQSELAKVRKDVEEEYAVRQEKFLSEISERIRLETEMEVLARSELKLQDELQRKDEEHALQLEKQLNEKLETTKTEAERNCASRYEAEFREKFEQAKIDLESSNAERVQTILDEQLKLREEMEKQYLQNFDETIHNEVENAKEVMKKECMAKYAIRLKEELERVKEETEKECMLQYKIKLEQELKKERAVIEKQLSLSFEKKLVQNSEAVRLETENICGMKYDEKLGQELQLAKEEVEERLSKQCREESDERLEKLKNDAEAKLASVHEKYAGAIKDLTLEVEKLRARRERDEAAIATLECERTEMFKLFKLFSGNQVPAEEDLSAQEENTPEDQALKSSAESLPKDRVVGAQEQPCGEIRAAVEKEFMSKMHLLLKGYEDKKVKEITRLKSDAESELRCRDYRIHELEQLVQSLQQQGDSSSRCESFSLPNMNSMQESIMEDSSYGAGPSQYQDGGYLEDAKEAVKGDKDEDEERSEDDIAALAVNTRGVQSRLRLKDLRYMITVQDIRELSTVLIIYSEVHKAYILFCVNSTLYFVKESCLRRLGLKSDQPAAVPRKNWLLGVLTRMEFCQIRKTSNRYNLIIGTRFYRVEVDPLLIESSANRSNDD